MKVRTSLTIVSLIAAIGVVATPAGAKNVWDQLNEAAPKSIWDQLNETAPRTIFDEIADTAPVRMPDDDRAGDYVQP